MPLIALAPPRVQTPVGNRLVPSRPAGESFADSSYSPSQEQNLKVWLDAWILASLFQLSGGTTPVTADANPVGYWADQSRIGNHVIQATAGSRPSYKVNGINGRPAVDFPTDTSAYRLGRVYSAALSPPGTIFVVVKIDTPTTSDFFIDGIDGTNRWRMQLSSGTPQLWQIAAGNILTGGTADTNPHIHAVVINGASSKYFIDGAPAVVTGDAGAQTPAGLSVGNAFAGNNNSIDGAIGEVLLLNEASTSTTLNNIGNYLAAKWGLSWRTVP